MKSFLLSPLIVCLTLVGYAGDMEFPDFNKMLESNHVTKDYSDAAMDSLIGLVQQRLTRLEKDAQAKDALAAQDEKAAKDAKKLRALAQRVNAVLSDPRIKSQNVGDLFSIYRELKSLLYALDSEILGKQAGSGKGAVIGNVLGGSVKLQYFTPDKRDLPIGKDLAVLESYNLVDPSSGKEYAHPSELAALSVNQIASLDVRDDHSLWYTERQLEEIRKTGTPWQHLERRMEALTSKIIGESFQLDVARRVLVYDEIKVSATSPKIETKDLYGQKWKLKWGDETQTEPINNRLYVNLGSKYADLVYANTGGRKDVILILNESSPQSQDPKNCSSIATVKKFKECLLTSGYNFNPAPYIVESGVINESLLNDPNLTFSKFSDKKRQKLMGREFVVFSESMVEFQPNADIAARLGAVPFSNAGAAEDRVKRALVVFSYWIRNKDPKDDNNRGVIVEGKYLEYMHDLGASLADLMSAGNPNKVDPSFASISGENVVFDMSTLYKPVSFERATLADQLWMASKIFDLSLQDITDAVKASNWPSFQANAMMNRLVLRRNNLVKVYGIGQKIPVDERTVTLGVSLESQQRRLDIIREHNIALAFGGDETKALAAFDAMIVKAGGKIDKLGNATIRKKPFTDQLTDIRSGVISVAGCEESVTIAFLESTIRPNGLSRRIARRGDDKPLSACSPGTPAP